MVNPTQVMQAQPATSITSQAMQTLSNVFGTAIDATAQQLQKDATEESRANAIYNKQLLAEEFARGRLDVSAGQLATDLTVEGEDPVVRAREAGQRAAILDNMESQYTTDLDSWMVNNPSATPEEFKAEAVKLRSSYKQDSPEVLAAFSEYADTIDANNYRRLVKTQYQADSQQRLVHTLNAAERETNIALQTVRDEGSSKLPLSKIKEAYFAKTNHLVDDGLLSPMQQNTEWKRLENAVAAQAVGHIGDRAIDGELLPITVDGEVKNVPSINRATVAELVDSYKIHSKELQTTTRNELAKSGLYSPTEIDTIIKTEQNRYDAAYRDRLSGFKAQRNNMEGRQEISLLEQRAKGAIATQQPLVNSGDDKLAADLLYAKLIDPNGVAGLSDSIENKTDIKNYLNQPSQGYRTALYLKGIPPTNTTDVAAFKQTSSEIKKYTANMVRATGLVPTPVQRTLEQFLNTPVALPANATPEQVDNANNAVLNIVEFRQALPPTALGNSFNDETNIMYDTIDYLIQSGVQPVEAFNMAQKYKLQQGTDEHRMVVQTSSTTEFKTKVKDNLLEIGSDPSATFFGSMSSKELNSDDNRDFVNSYTNMVRKAYTLNGGNFDAATRFANTAINKQFGYTNINGMPQMMKYAPSKMVASLNGDDDKAKELLQAQIQVAVKNNIISEEQADDGEIQVVPAPNFDVKNPMYALWFIDGNNKLTVFPTQYNFKETKANE